MARKILLILMLTMMQAACAATTATKPTLELVPASLYGIRKAKLCQREDVTSSLQLVKAADRVNVTVKLVSIIKDYVGTHGAWSIRNFEAFLGVPTLFGALTVVRHVHFSANPVVAKYALRRAHTAQPGCAIS